MKKTLFTAFAAGLVFTAGMTAGAHLTRENVFHAETFEVEVFEDYSMTGEPVTGEGEGINFDNAVVWEYIEGQRIESGDTVTVYWLNKDAETSNWNNIADIQKAGN